jgi:hypothetical protein
MADCADRQAFSSRLQAALADRVRDQVSVFVVPESMPWTDLWLRDAHARLNGLRSDNRFASVVFVAEPATLWRLLRDGEAVVGSEFPWMSLLHWNDGFLRHWLDECQVSLEQDDRRKLADVTGLWPALLTMRVGDRPGQRILRERIEAAASWPAESDLEEWRGKLGLDVAEPARILDELARWDEPLTASDIGVVGEFEIEHVQKCLRWAELLGRARRDGAGYWTVDAVAAKVLRGLAG